MSVLLDNREFPLIDKQFFVREVVSVSPATIRLCMETVRSQRKDYLKILLLDQTDDVNSTEVDKAFLDRIECNSSEAVEKRESEVSHTSRTAEQCLQRIANYDFVLLELAQLLSDISQASERAKQR